jgi:hypothetical protein
MLDIRAAGWRLHTLRTKMGPGRSAAPQGCCCCPLRIVIVMEMRNSRAFSFLLAIATSLSASAQVTAVRSARMIDVERGEYVNNAVILIEHGKITQVGSGLAIPAGATLIDLKRRRSFPGRVHICPPLPSNIVAESDLTRFCRFAFI